MTAIRWSPEAVADLQDIHDWIARDSPRYARAMVSRLVEAVEQLVVQPRSGRTMPEAHDPTIRELIVESYRLVYRVRDEHVEVITVFHAARLPPDL